MTRPKILCITHHDPDSADYGAVVRARNIFKLLARVGEVRVVLAGFREAWAEHPDGTCGGFPLLRQLRFQWSERITVADRLRHELDPRFMNKDWFQASPADTAWLQGTMADHDLVWVHGLSVANRFNLWRWPRAILDLDDITSEVLRSHRLVADNLLEKMQAARRTLLWQRHEKFLPERFDVRCVCSEEDRVKLGRPENTFVVANGFDRPRENYSRRPVTPPRVGFVGSFEYGPNLLGMRWFVRNIWPVLLSKYPAARLRLVGTGGREQSWPEGQNIEPLGWLADVESEMATWSLAVVPVLTGGGTRVKMAEAFSRHCPVVSTSLGAYGYDVSDGQEIFIADAPKAFAGKCGRLLDSPSLQETMAAKAWEKFIKLWTWDVQAGNVAAAVEKILAAPKS